MYGSVPYDWQESMLEESQNHREDFRIEGEGELVRATNWIFLYIIEKPG